MSRICGALDAEVEAFRGRPLDARAYPYVWLDALYHKVREQGRVVNMATLVAIGVEPTGVRRILGVEVAAGDDEGAPGRRFLRSLVERGLTGVRLVISDAHAGLVAAIREPLLGAAWQRCRVHFTRNALALVPRVPGASSRRPSGASSSSPTRHPPAPSAPGGRRPAARFPAVAELLDEAEADLLAHFTFPGPPPPDPVAPTPTSGSTRRSSAGPTSSASSPPGPA